jgi:serine/threonine-protein kinase
VPQEELPSRPSAIPDPLVGLVVGEFLVTRLLGAGSFGRVYLGVQPSIMLRAAVKILDLGGVADSLRDLFGGKFEAEARALALVQHPNVVRLLRYGHFLDRPYLAMEYVEGGVGLDRAMAQRARERQGYTAEEVGSLVGQLLDGLAAAHARGVIHRDVKPANLMLQEAVGHPRMVRILDFGLAKFLEDGDATLVASGTPDYMAPEQLRKESLGPWTDLYAVGTIAFELLTGRKPFSSETVQQTLYQKLDPAYDPTVLLDGPGLPGRAREFLRRALAWDHRARHRSAQEMREDLLAALQSMANGRTSPASLPPAPRPEEVATVGDPANVAEASRRRSDEAFRRWLEREGEGLEQRARRLGPAARRG